MICWKCGYINDTEAGYCSRCNAILNQSESELAIALTEDYESNLGFSKSDSFYEKSQVINSPTEPTRQKEMIKPEITLPSGYLIDNQQSLSRYMYEDLNQNLVEQEKDTPLTMVNKVKTFQLLLIGIATGAMVLMLLFLYFGNSDEELDYTFLAKNAIEVFVNDNQQQTYVFNTKGDLLHKIEYTTISNYTPDHSAAILYNYSLKTCIYVNANAIIELSSPVTAFCLSADGNYIVYSVEGGLNKYFLYLYDVLNREEVLLDSQEKVFELFHILPGAKAITYNTYQRTNGQVSNIEAYLIRDGGKPELVGKDIAVIAISQDLKNIYGIEISGNRLGAYYVMQGDKKTLLSEEQIHNWIYFNKDYSEIMITEGDSYYLSENGNPRQKSIDKIIGNFLQPDQDTVMFNNTIMYLGINTFQNKVFQSEDRTIHILDENYQSQQLGVTYFNQHAILSKDGKQLVYKGIDEMLLKITDLGGERIQEVWVDQVDDFAVSKDFSQVYYLRENRLYYKEKDNEEILISENVRNICGNNNGDAIFFLKDYTEGMGTLYYSIAGAAPKQVEGGTAVNGIKEWNFGVVYQKLVNGQFAVFYNTKGTEFTFIMDGVNFID